MHRLGIALSALTVLLCGTASAQSGSMIVQTPTESINNNLWLSFRRTVVVNFSNSGSESADISWSTVDGSQSVTKETWEIERNLSVSGGGEEIEPGEVVTKTIGEIGLRVRRIVNGPSDSVSYEASWVLELESDEYAVSSTVSVGLYGTVDCPGGSARSLTVPALELDWDVALPPTQVVFSFDAGNESGGSREIGIVAQIDGQAVPWSTLPVPATEGPHVFAGSFLAPSDSFGVVFPGGTLIAGTSSWTAGDELPWPASILFSGDLPEEIRVRMRLEVFTDEPVTLNILDEGGSVVGSVDLQAGVFAQEVDVPVMAAPGSDLSFTVTGAAGYVATPSGSTSVDGGGNVNVIPIRVHADDDIPVVAGSTTSNVVSGGQTSSTTTQTVGNSQGTITNTTGGQLQPWNPVGGATSGNYFTTTTPGTGSVDTLARIDAEMGTVAAQSGSLPSGAAAQEAGEGVVADLEAAEDGIRDGLGSGVFGPDGPQSGTFGSDADWTISVPTIFGHDVPDIVVPLTHPAVGIIRSFLLVASSLWWLFKTYELFKV